MGEESKRGRGENVHSQMSVNRRNFFIRAQLRERGREKREGREKEREETEIEEHCCSAGLLVNGSSDRSCTRGMLHTKLHLIRLSTVQYSLTEQNLNYHSFNLRQW